MVVTMFTRLGPVLRNCLYRYSFGFSRSLSSNKCGHYEVKIIPALKDNYMYLLIDNAQHSAIAIDPVEPDKIFRCLNEENVSLDAVLTTHHHFDHAGGNAKLSERVKNIPIYGGDDRIEALTDKLSHNETLRISNILIKCLHTPCHTLGHVCYFVESDNPICFTGDTLFIGGCGRFFEGSAEHMFESLNILRSLPLNTKLYCGHEYTLSNLKFASYVESGNKAILNRIKSAEKNLERNEPTVPSTLEDELSFNPFLRTDIKSIQNFVQQSDPVAVIKALRELKDNF